jgi:iron complex transport system permease protein
VKSSLKISFLAALAALFFVMDIVAGSVRIAPTEVLRILLGGEGTDAAWRDIVLFFRLPRALTAVAAGMGLSVGGLSMQTLFRNPLAGPSVLGINAGANLGVALVILLLGTGSGAGVVSLYSLWTKSMVILAAVAGGGAVLVLILAISRYIASVTMLLLFGLMFGYLANSVVTLLIHFATAGQVQAYIQWTFGSFGSTTWEDLAILLPVVVLLLVPALLLIKPLNALLLGEEYARSMGVSIRRVRVMIISLTSLYAGIITAFCGPVTFIGVAVPHMARGIMDTSDHRPVVPATILLGISTALLADLISHTPGSPGVLPLNAVTALLGVPVVIWVLVRRSRSGGVYE